jgi:N utilization substance protein B
MLSRRLLRIKAVKALYAHFKSESDSPAASEKNLMYSVDKTYRLYHLLLGLIVEVARTAENRIERGRQKRLPTPEDLHPNLKFVENRVIRRLADSEALADFLNRHKLGWTNHPELIRKIYNQLVASDYYQAYMAGGKSDFAEDLRLVVDFYTHELEDLEALEEALEEQSIYWADDLGFALGMVVRTLQEMRESRPGVPLLPQYRQDDDRRFVVELFRRALAGSGEYFALIDAGAPNWDLERIAYMDRLIMVTTIAELVHFPTIPVKVTLDEYIEIAKYYSTPASSTFINGVLDKIVESLKQEGKIQKAGRGLVER